MKDTKKRIVGPNLAPSFINEEHNFMWTPRWLQR
jgi:hypothetical protein